MYQVSPRVTLARGDKFRVSGGPYWRGATGKVSLAHRGIMTLLDVVRHGARVYLIAKAKDGIACLHVEGRRRNKVAPEIVCRPYRVKAKLRVPRP